MKRIGIYTIVTLLAFISCKKESYVTTQFVMKNLSDYTVTIEVEDFVTSEYKVKDTTFYLNVNDSIVYNYSDLFLEFPFPFGPMADSLQITFNTGITVLVPKQTKFPGNPFYMSSYKGKKESSELYRYCYEFDNTSYNILENYLNNN